MDPTFYLYRKYKNNISNYQYYITLGQHYEEFIQANIAGGRYNNASEVVRAALRRLEEDEARIAAFCAAVDEGDASPDVLDFDEEAFIQGLKEGWRNNG